MDLQDKNLRLKLIVYLTGAFLLAGFIFMLALLLSSQRKPPQTYDSNLNFAEETIVLEERVISPDRKKEILVTFHQIDDGVFMFPVGWRFAVGKPGFAFDDAEFEIKHRFLEYRLGGCVWVNNTEITVVCQGDSVEIMKMLDEVEWQWLGDVEVEYIK